MDEIIESLGISDSWLWIAVLVLLIICIIFLILLVRQNGKIRKLSERLDNFCMGSDGQSLEDDIANMFDENDEIRTRIDNADAKIQNLYWRLKCTVQKVGIVKYDAFPQMGGMLSYAIAFLDENNDGMVMNCVHSVDSCYTYTKVVKSGRADVDLGAEEAKALQMALDNFHPAGKSRTDETVQTKSSKLSRPAAKKPQSKDNYD